MTQNDEKETYKGEVLIYTWEGDNERARHKQSDAFYVLKKLPKNKFI